MVFTGDDIKNVKSSMLYDSNIFTINAGKYKALANSMQVSLRWHHVFPHLYMVSSLPSYSSDGASMGDGYSNNFSHSVVSYMFMVTNYHNTMEKFNPPSIDLSLIHYFMKQTWEWKKEVQYNKSL